MAGVGTQRMSVGSDPWAKSDEDVQKMLDESKSEDERQAEELLKAEKREVLPGVTMEKLVDELSHKTDLASDFWDRMCQTEQGRKILFHLYAQLEHEHNEFVKDVADRAKDATLSLEGVNATPETQDELEEAESYVSDIQTAADEIGSDVYRAQVCNAPFSN